MTDVLIPGEEFMEPTMISQAHIRDELVGARDGCRPLLGYVAIEGVL